MMLDDLPRVPAAAGSRRLAIVISLLVAFTPLARAQRSVHRSA